jgi:hypothetical protein
MVEYWSRGQYINLDAHADIDENTLKEEGVLRCPKHGHVLYLQIANSKENTVASDGDGVDATIAAMTDEEKQVRMGPTVLFNRKVAWGSVTPRGLPSVDDSAMAASHNSPANMMERVQEYIVDVENYWDEETKRQYGLHDNDHDNINHSKEEEKMTIVPAVNGRLLRFDGAAFHSVPKPPHRYLLSDDELTSYLERDCEEDCQDGDNLDDDDNEWYDEDEASEKEDLSQQRSVILFNTWQFPGPRGVLPDCVVEAVPDGIALVDDDSTSVEDDRVAEQWRKWRDEYGSDAEKLRCNPVGDWKLCIVNNLDSDENSFVTVPLMGNPTRRGCIKNKALMQGQGKVDRLEDAFYDGCIVSTTTLTEL